LVAGLNEFTLVATDRAGNQTTQTLRVTLGSSLQLAVSAPQSGATINGSRVYVTGTVQTSDAFGVSVNGHAATVVGTQFVAEVDLSSGANVLTVTATALNGATAVATLVVASIQGGPEPHFIESAGIAPFTAQISIPAGFFAAIDFDGDGSYDQFVFGSGGRIPFTYMRPGTYMARVLLADDVNVCTFVMPIVVEDVRVLDVVVRSTFSAMTDRLRAGDIEGALQLFTPAGADQYRPVLQQLAGQLTQVADQIGTIVDGYMTTEMAEYLVVQDTPGGRKGFLIYILKGADGVWRIAQL
jgi:hypothetical protein